jgi:hypothetical protein
MKEHPFCPASSEEGRNFPVLRQGLRREKGCAWTASYRSKEIFDKAVYHHIMKLVMIVYVVLS